jgi:superfamily II DNA/RNA helicase
MRIRGSSSRSGSSVSKEHHRQNGFHSYMSFAELGLSAKVLEAVATAGFTTPTPIQEQGIPPALQRKDVLGLAQTGSGKTAAFVLPMLTMLEKGRARARMPRTLILEPTRELAAQVHEAFETLGKNHRLTVALLIGGVSFDDQAAKIDRGADVVIATPGRLLDHRERGKLLLNGVEILVIDEADRMLDMGFIPDIERICKLLPFTRQTLFFSATMPPEIQRLTGQFLHNPARIEVSPPASTVSTIVQRVVRAPADVKARRDVLRALLKSQTNVKNAIIFANRKTTVAVLETSLRRHGFNASALHGDMDQSNRLKTLAAFRANEITYLVASDVAARGLDIPDVSHIFNFDVPIHAEDYVHRIGRTGRAGREGFSFTLVSSAELKHLKAIEQLIKRQIEWADGPAGIEWQPSATPPHGERKPEPRRAPPKAHAPPKVHVPRQQPNPPQQPAPPRRPSRPPHEPAEPARFNTGNLPAFLARPVRSA